MKRSTVWTAAAIVFPLTVAITAPGDAYANYTLQSFGSNQYLGGTPANLAVMRQNLGIAGAVVEDFATLALPSGILTFSGSGVIDVVAENGNSWGQIGTGFVRILTTPAAPATIQIAGGVPLFGLGFSAFESGTGGALTSISINGGALIPLNSTSLPSFTFAPTVRNGYLVITAGSADPLISRIDLFQTGSADGYQLDYIALGAVPELQSTTLFALGSALLVVLIRAQRRYS